MALTDCHDADLSCLRSRAYGQDSDEVAHARAEVKRFAIRAGRQPRILIAKMGQDGHDRGAKVLVAPAFQFLARRCKLSLVGKSLNKGSFRLTVFCPTGYCNRLGRFRI